MNGRVYDPELGRFLSADPFVQDLTNLQAHNRYTYVLNNPLSLTDPTGFFFGVIFRKVPILGQIAQIAICAYGGPYACVAAAGAFSIATGGSLADAFQAAAIAAASIYVYGEVGDFLGDVLEGVDDLATKIAVKGSVHGVVGGAFNVARGGSFQTGFISGSIGAAAGGAVGESALAGIEGETGEYIRSAVVGIAGGAAAVATGGKFENGFVTAAFAHLWNAEGGRERPFRGLLRGIVQFGARILTGPIGWTYAVYDFLSGTELGDDTLFWTRTEFEGITVYQRNDLIDPNFITPSGRTNLDLMQDGLAPFGPDSEPINLHHMLQTNDGPVAEVTTTFHRENSRVIHLNPGNTVPSGINRSGASAFRSRYWQWRAQDFQ